MLTDRSRDRSGRHLEWRVRLFGAGAVLAVVGMFTEQGWLIDLAIVVLLAGFALRFVIGEPDASDDPERGDTDS